MSGSSGGLLRELFIRLGVDGDAKGLESFEKKVEGVFGRLKAGAEAVVEALALKEIGEFFAKTIEGAGHVHDLSEKLDVSATFLENFGLVAKQSGVDFEESSAAIGHFNQHVGEAITKGGEVAKTFGQLGIKLKQGTQARPVVDLLLDVSEALKKQPDQFRRTAYAQQLFGRSGRQILPVLAQGKEALQGMLDQANALGSGLGDQFYADADAATDAMDRFKFGLHSLALRLAAEVLPLVTKFTLGLEKLAIRVIAFTKHSNVLRTGLLFLATVLGVRLVASLKAVGQALGLVREGALQTLLAFAEFAVIAAVLGLIYLAFDDLYTLMTGGQSVIGDFIDKMYGVGASKKFVEQIKTAWEQLGKALEPLTPTFQALGGFFAANLPGAIMGTVKAFVYLVGIIDDAITGARELYGILQRTFEKDKGKAAGELDQLDSLDKDRQARANSRQAILDTLNGIAAPPGYAAPPGQQPAPTGTAPVPAARGSRGSGKPGVVQSNTISVNVTTASDDPKAVGKAVGQGVATEVEKANNRALAAVASP